MGASEWRDKFATGLPILGGLGEPGVYPPSAHPPSYINREELSGEGMERVLSNNRSSDPNARQLRFGAMDQAEYRWLDGPHRFND